MMMEFRILKRLNPPVWQIDKGTETNKQADIGNEHKPLTRQPYCTIGTESSDAFMELMEALSFPNQHAEMPTEVQHHPGPLTNDFRS